MAEEDEVMGVFGSKSKLSGRKKTMAVLWGHHDYVSGRMCGEEKGA